MGFVGSCAHEYTYTYKCLQINANTCKDNQYTQTFCYNAFYAILCYTILYYTYLWDSYHMPVCTQIKAPTYDYLHMHANRK